MFQKSIQSFFMASLVALSVWACTQPTPAPVAATSTARMAQASLPDAIDSLTASREKTSWDSLRQIMQRQVGAANAPFLVQGFKVPFDDLEGIIAAYRDGNRSRTDAVGAMISIRNGKTSLILQVKDLTTGKNVYYDFSVPCPPNCPD